MHKKSTDTIRMTKPRQAVFDIIRAAQKPMGAYDIIRAMTPQPKPPTVYRALEFLVDNGQVHRIESLNAYMACNAAHACCDEHKSHNHAHTTQFIVCEDCGNVEEVAATTQIHLHAQNGFKARRIVTEILGTCGRCT
jgi:Fur family zinc uptake transcriptional regulator